MHIDALFVCIKDKPAAVMMVRLKKGVLGRKVLDFSTIDKLKAPAGRAGLQHAKSYRARGCPAPYVPIRFNSNRRGFYQLMDCIVHMEGTTEKRREMTEQTIDSGVRIPHRPLFE
jgi:hypothetical protein